jgi:hypothetical protein
MKNVFCIFLLCILFIKVQAQNVGINATGATPDNSAMLDVDAANKGLLIPRIQLLSVTDIITIATPTKSLLVYNKNGNTLQMPEGEGYYYWDGSKWVKLQTNATNNAWLTNGNVGTTPTTNFIGTNDDNSLVLKVNKVFSGILDSSKQNTATGFRALQYALDSIGKYNTAVGYNGLSFNGSGSHNTALGKDALKYNTIGDDNTANGDGALLFNRSGTGNTASGRASLLTNTNGYNNTANGYLALNNNNGNRNIGIGTSSGTNITTGNNNIAIGNNTNVLSGTADNQLNIGNEIYGLNLGTVNSTLGVGTNNPTTKWHINGKIRIDDGTQGNGKILQSDANGVGSWVKSNATVSAVNGVFGAGVDVTSSTWQYTTAYVDLPPGRWMVFGTYLIIPSNKDLMANEGVWMRTTFSDNDISFSYSGDLIGARLISGNLNGNQSYSLANGQVIINNTSASTKRYYVWAEIDKYDWKNNGYQNTALFNFKLSNFCGSYWNENQITAIPMN